MEIDSVLSKLSGVRRSGSGWTARCPVHDDRDPSLSISIGRNGKLLLYCHAGCSYKDIVSVLGISPERKPIPWEQIKKRREEKAEQLELNETYKTLATVVRTIDRCLYEGGINAYQSLTELVYDLPYLEYLLELMRSRDAEERRQGVKEAMKWLNP